MILEAATPSGRKTADAAISALPCALTSVILEGDGTNACDITIYDNATAASGTIIAKIMLPASAAKSFVFNPVYPIRCLNGIFVDVTGTNAAYIVHYLPL